MTSPDPIVPSSTVVDPTLPPTTAQPVMSDMTGVPVYAGPAPTPDAKTMAMLANLLACTLIGPLVIYLVKKDSHPFVADQSKEALNFSLCCFIAQVGITIISVFIHLAGLLSPLVFLGALILGIMGGLKARDGIAYRYPIAFRLIK